MCGQTAGHHERCTSLAASSLPLHSASAFLQSIMPAPVFWRRDLTAKAEMPGREKEREKERERERGRERHQIKRKSNYDAT